MIETFAWVVGIWFVLACIVGFCIAYWLDKLDNMFEVTFTLMDEIEVMTTAELEKLQNMPHLSMDERLAVMDELQKRKQNPQRPTDSQFECFGCGS
jgi:hypothetical protein